MGDVISDKIRIKDLAKEFSCDFYEEYSNKEVKTYIARNADGVAGPLEIPGYKVSPKKIGVYVRGLGIRTLRDGNGYYIPLYQEFGKLKLIAERFGLEEIVSIPRDLKELVKHLEKIKKEREKLYSEPIDESNSNSR